MQDTASGRQKKTKAKINLKTSSILWGIGFIIAGVIPFAFPKIFDTAIGIFMIVLGVAALVLRKKWVLAAMGISLILIGLINIAMTLMYQSSSVFIVLGIAEVLIGTGALSQNLKFS